MLIWGKAAMGEEVQPTELVASGLEVSGLMVEGRVRVVGGDGVEEDLVVRVPVWVRSGAAAIAGERMEELRQLLADVQGYAAAVREQGRAGRALRKRWQSFFDGVSVDGHEVGSD